MVPLQAITGLAILTIVGQISLIAIILSYILRYKFEVFDKITYITQENRIQLVLSISVIATLASLFLSEIGGFIPCKLCWFQRIFMYPIPIILLVGLYKKRPAFDFAAPLSAIGTFIAGYHYYIQRMALQNPEAGHSAIGSCGSDGVSCTAQYINEFGYISIPLMAFTAFSLITIIFLISRNR